jgi:hypothetical protein
MQNLAVEDFLNLTPLSHANSANEQSYLPAQVPAPIIAPVIGQDSMGPEENNESHSSN